MWIVTGFIGSSFSVSSSNQTPLINALLSTSTTDGGLAGGVQLARFWGGYLGAEFLADFGVSQTTSLFLSTDPNVNSYMLNAIVKAPFGGVGRFEPYISGGLGAISMRSSTFTLVGDTTITGNLIPTLSTVNTTQTKFGTDIGAGFFAFANKWGIRGMSAITGHRRSTKPSWRTDQHLRTTTHSRSCPVSRSGD